LVVDVESLEGGADGEAIPDVDDDDADENNEDQKV
jgi:hypothetical protein